MYKGKKKRVQSQNIMLENVQIDHFKKKSSENLSRSSNFFLKSIYSFFLTLKISNDF